MIDAFTFTFDVDGLKLFTVPMRSAEKAWKEGLG